MIEGCVPLFFSTDIISMLELSMCGVAMILMLRYFGLSGLYVYLVITSVTANIQSLKIINYSFIQTPMVLGTIVFSTNYIVGNLMAEYYSEQEAKRGILISFAGYIFFALIMFLTIKYPTCYTAPAGTVNLHEPLRQVFTPTPYLLIASILAFIIGQYTNVTIYSAIKRITPQSMIWLRSLLSLATSTFVDVIVYSVLAWKVFYALPIGWKTLLSTYVIGNYVFVLIISLCSSPIVYLAKRFVPKDR